MKRICVFKRLLFINVLCLLCLPNFCDIKENGADGQDLQNSKTVSDDFSRTENVPSKQEKEIHQQPDLNVILEDVKPNVEYVNIENRVIKENDDSTESPMPILSEKPIVQNLFVGRIGDIDGNDDLSLKSKSDEVVSSPISKSAEKPVLNVPDVKADRVSPLVSSYPSPVEKQPLKLTETVPEVLNVVEEQAASPIPVKTVKPAAEDHHPPHYDGMPSFDEWKKMMLAEQQKGGKKVSPPTPPGKKISSQKRRRNYSSFECGAKIVASNTEAEGTSRILNELLDEYMLNPCKAKIWFVIELCETVQATQIELANFELFSSCVKDFAVYSSDNFPTRDWVPLGTFTAAEQRVLQSFELKQEGFGKFIKIELLSHYGAEHYCPLSVVRIFGASMVDEYEEMETQSLLAQMQEDESDRLDLVTEDKKAPNIFGSAKDAVINIVKKAAEALGHQNLDEKKNNETLPDQQNSSGTKFCSAVDQSQDKCIDVSSKTDQDMQSLNQLPVPSSSMHRSLFRLLHRCDQCVSSRIRYYSSAQPICRFFQAALGPIVFQTLCDWFKEHPIIIPQEPSHRNKLPLPNLDYLKNKSPPPQVMRVESDLPWKKLIPNDPVLPLGPVVTLNSSVTSDKVVNASTVRDGIQLQPSIQPTGSRQDVLTTAYNESESTPSYAETSKPVAVLSGTTDKSTSPTPVAVSAESTVPVQNSVEPTLVPTIDVPDTLTDLEVEQQMSAFITANILSPEDISVAEMPADLKQNIDKPAELNGKVEPAGNDVARGQSIFTRMGNRIKALEINMSLSSQYLQELSQRYRRQMDEMQRAFNRTIGTLNDTARKAAERDLKQQDVLNNLQLQVSNLSQTVELLLHERSAMSQQFLETHICLMIVEAIIMITIMSLCVRRISSSAGHMPPPAMKESIALSPRLSKRRSSVDSCTPPVARKVKKRSASEEAINAGEGLLIIEPLPVLIDPILKAKKRNRKRNKAIQRSNSNPTVPRKNSNSTSQCEVQRASCSDSHIQASVKSKLQSHGTNSACENCNNNSCTVIKIPEKDKRANGAPFQNLTNGSIINRKESKSDKISRGKERFSFKKLLKFQKRDSI